MSTRHVWGRYDIATNITVGAATTVSDSFNGTASQPFWCLAADSIAVTADNKIQLISPTEYTFSNSSSTKTIDLTDKYYVFGSWSTGQKDSYDQCYFGGSLTYSRTGDAQPYWFWLKAQNAQPCTGTQGRGSLNATISSNSDAAYPVDGISGSYWYTYQGSDSIDPVKVDYASALKGGETVTIDVTPGTNTYGGTISYQYEVSLDGGSTWEQLSLTDATNQGYTIPKGTETFRARVQARDNLGFTSADWVYGTQYSVVNNSAPSVPGSITVPVSPRGGGETTITWTAASDVDGNLTGYELERQLDGGDWAQVYAGSGLSYVDVIPKGTLTAAYRVRAYDEDGAYSGYTASATRAVVNNDPPVISCELSGDLGVKSEGFTVPYIVTDAEGGTVTVIEQVGDLVKRTYEVTLGEEQTFHVEDQNGDYFFMRILNGDNVIKITATDEAGQSSTLELTFTKAVHAMSVTMAEPLEVAEPITVAILSVLGSIPDEAEYKVLVTNNAKDAEPVWQDATAAIKAGNNIAFANTVQANGPAFNFKLTVSRGASGEGGYVKMLKGAFQ